MKRLISSLSALALVSFFAGCASTPSAPPRPLVVYPVTYDVPVGNTQVRADSGPQNLNVSATQQVATKADTALYYQIISPVAVTVSIYERPSDTSGRILVKEMQGTSFTSSLIPRSSSVEFVFSALESNSSGTLKFTLSDRPLAPAVTR